MTVQAPAPEVKVETPAPSAAPAAAAPTPAATRAGSNRPLLGRVVNQKRVKVERVWKKDIADVASANRQCLHAHRVAAAHRHLHVLKVHVHVDVTACKESMAGSRGCCRVVRTKVAMRRAASRDARQRRL